MRRELELQPMSSSGATSPPSAADADAQILTDQRSKPARLNETGRDDASLDAFFLPDFCVPRIVLGVVLISELLALVLTLARPDRVGFLQELARISLFMQWLGLTSAALLCYSRRFLARMAVPTATACVFALLLVNTAVLSEIAYRLGMSLNASGISETLFPESRWSFLLRNLGICVIVTALLLRYFFVAHAWQRNVRAEARSRISALQARIRPHFLFNSMNTIASLTRTAPKLAEEAVEDLADLFRATLKDSATPLRLKEELEVSRMYQRIEALRLGDRLAVSWDVQALPMRAIVPSLTIQPLLENAIYHGIEPLDRGGTVAVHGCLENGDIVLTVTNPVPADGRRSSREGSQTAIDNIRQRLDLAYGDRGRLEVTAGDGRYTATLRFPHEE
jgi:two-component system sensor histidine kinase AlgZ